MLKFLIQLIQHTTLCMGIFQSSVHLPSMSVSSREEFVGIFLPNVGIAQSVAEGIKSVELGHGELV